MLILSKSLNHPSFKKFVVFYAKTNKILAKSLVKLTKHKKLTNSENAKKLFDSVTRPDFCRKMTKHY